MSVLLQGPAKLSALVSSRDISYSDAKHNGEMQSTKRRILYTTITIDLDKAGSRSDQELGDMCCQQSGFHSEDINGLRP